MVYVCACSHLLQSLSGGQAAGARLRPLALVAPPQPLWGANVVRGRSRFCRQSPIAIRQSPPARRGGGQASHGNALCCNRQSPIANRHRRVGGREVQAMAMLSAVTPAAAAAAAAAAAGPACYCMFVGVPRLRWASLPTDLRPLCSQVGRPRRLGRGRWGPGCRLARRLWRALQPPARHLGNHLV